MANLVSPFVGALETKLDWSIERNNVLNEKTGKKIEGMVTLTNTKTGHEIFTTNATYKETRPEFFQEVAEIVSKKTGMELIGYHTFSEGEKILGYLRNVEVEEQYRKILKLKNESFCVIGTGNDGKDPFFVGSVEYILRCQNQWGRVNRNIKFKHTKKHEETVLAFINSISKQTVSDFELIKKLDKMQKIKIDTDLLVSIVDRFLGVERPLNETEKANFKLPTRTQNNFDIVMQSMEIERGDLGNNLFGTFNGFTHYISNVWNGDNAKSAPGNILNGYERQTEKAFNAIEHYFQLLS